MSNRTFPASARNADDGVSSGSIDLVRQKKLLQSAAESTSNRVSTHASGPSLIAYVAAVPNAAVVASARETYPRAAIVEFSRPEDLARTANANSAGGILILQDPDSEIVKKAGGERDATGLPLWSLVIVASDDLAPGYADFLDLIPQSELNSALISRILRSAWDRYSLAKDNARLRGNLLTFGSRIAHDLRTPLGGVLTTTEMLREVLADDAPADVPLTQPILDSTDGLVKLIERTSFFARASGSHDEARAVDMGAPFWNAYQRLERTMLQAKASMKHPASWPKVVGHENWLEAVWAILLTNAIQHGGAGAQIEAGWSTVEYGQRFWVRSTAKVSSDKRETLFFPFHRLHEAGAPRGLGLPMMQSLVEADGGCCGFQDTPDGGAEFFFVLPAHLDGASPTAARPSAT